MDYGLEFPRRIVNIFSRKVMLVCAFATICNQTHMCILNFF